MKKNSFEKKVNRARQVEREILKWYRRDIDEKARLVQGNFPDYDIFSRKGCVEIKEDRLAHQTGKYALEFETHDGRPSGFLRTKADIFIITDWEYVNVVATEVLKEIIESAPKKTIFMGDTFKDGKQNKGYLIPRGIILENPWVSVYKRWFPVYEG